MIKHTDTNSIEVINFYNSPIVKNSTPVRMLIFYVISCLIGIGLMAEANLYYMLGVFIGLLGCVTITTLLLSFGKISVETACLVPMLILCFVYTPVSWYTFDGLTGCTPYLSILFFTIITLTYYGRTQMSMLVSYAFLMFVLIVHWMSVYSGEKSEIQTINILAAYILTAALTVNIVEAVKQKNLRTNKIITDMSLHDELTGLLNRRAVKQVLNKLDIIYEEEGTDYIVIILDIDHFKSINDNYGHDIGDKALKYVAQCIQKNIRSTDDAFRFGGDEFLIVLCGVDKKIASKICKDIQNSLYEIQEDFRLSVSMGYSLRSEGSSINEILKSADDAMYRKKRYTHSS